jgi:FAD/FMN-containing dehydrogenase
VLHKMPKHIRTVCLEFFGQPKDAVPSIVEIKNYLDGLTRAAARGGPDAPPRVLLAGLEHLDERYLRAVGYTTKSRRGGLPKMVLFGDIVGDDDDAVARATSEVVRLANGRSGEGFIAVSPEARKTFWLDRSRTAAIARHTNAFKINEDVVIPLPRMGEYTDGIERINIELSTRNKLRLLNELDRLFEVRDARWARPTTSLQRRCRLTNWWPSARAPGARPDRLDPRALAVPAREHRPAAGRRCANCWPRSGPGLEAAAGRRAPGVDAAAPPVCSCCCRTAASVCPGRPKCARRWREILQGQAVPAAAQALRRDAQAGAAQPGVRRPAHACR